MFNMLIPGRTGKVAAMLKVFIFPAGNFMAVFALIVFILSASTLTGQSGTQVGNPWGIYPAEKGSGFYSAKSLPNPFSERTVVQFFLERRTQVSLEFHDGTGKLLTALDGGTMEPGIQRISIDVGDFPAGLLLCRIRTGGSVQYLKMIRLAEKP
jgi:hypothetical protein